MENQQETALALTQHYTIRELAKKWGLSASSLRRIFDREPGVLKIITGPETKMHRAYRTLRIPFPVAERVHKRLLG